jgi:hypothetical protein
MEEDAGSFGSPRPKERRMPSPLPAKQAPKQAPEGILLFILVVAILITLASVFLSRHPAAGISLPFPESKTQESSHTK